MSPMRLAGIRATGFRNLSGFVPLHSGVAVVVGENNAGKSNLIDACRLLFEPEAGPAARLWITEGDFAHDGHGNRVKDTFELEAEFADLDEADRARMVTCLAPSRGSDRARLRLRASLTGSGKVRTEWFGGDSENPDVEAWAREAVTFTYLHPLRDAASDLRPGRANRLASLIGTLAPDGHADRDAIQGIMRTANRELLAVRSIATAKERVHNRLTGLTGGGRLAQSSDLVFAEPRFDKVVATLRALVGSAGPVELTESGLGYSNLLYMSVLLSALEEETEAALRLLLIEEPEAHLHPQLQDLLMRYLEQAGTTRTQVVVTTHSPNLASSAKVERLTVLSREAGRDELVGRCVADFCLSSSDLGHLRRFLDVTKSALLFSRGVVLVEGVAEQLLVPVIAESMDLSLAEAGISVVNVGGLAFGPFIELFGRERLPFRCAVITDADPPEPDDDEAELDDSSVVGFAGAPLGPPAVRVESELQLSPTAQLLKQRETNQVRVFFAEKTLEWDIVKAGNWDLALEALRTFKPRVSVKLKDEYATSSFGEQADMLLSKVKKKKGDFAMALSSLIASGSAFEAPLHIRKAIEWVVSRGVAEVEREELGADQSGDFAPGVPVKP